MRVFLAAVLALVAGGAAADPASTADSVLAANHAAVGQPPASGAAQ